MLDQSRDIMHWALAIDDPQQWLNEELVESINQLIDYNDNQFKTHLDHYKYWERYPAESQQFYRAQGEAIFDRSGTAPESSSLSAGRQN